MELVDGPSLADLISQGPLSLAETARIADQIADGLSSAHARGIVHRDLKPSNVCIVPDGRVKILDLGLAKMVASDPGLAAAHPAREDAETLAETTREGTVLGTAAYMSPEQAVGAPVDTHTDVWAFGALLFEMLSGRRALPGRTITETLTAVLRGGVDWQAMPAGVPREIRTLIERCLVPEASGRLSDLGEARDALRPFADSGLVVASRPSPGTSPAPTCSKAACGARQTACGSRRGWWTRRTTSSSGPTSTGARWTTCSTSRSACHDRSWTLSRFG